MQSPATPELDVQIETAAANPALAATICSTPMKMKPSDRKEYEALKDTASRAKWLLAKGVTAKLTIDPEKLAPAYQAYSAGCSLPHYFPTAEEAVAKATAWLAALAGVSNDGAKASGA